MKQIKKFLLVAILTSAANIAYAKIDGSTPVSSLLPGSIQLQQTGDGGVYQYWRWPLQDGKPSGVFGVETNVDPTKPVCFMTGVVDYRSQSLSGKLSYAPVLNDTGWYGLYFTIFTDLTVWCLPPKNTILTLKDMQDAFGKIAPITIVN